MFNRAYAVTIIANDLSETENAYRKYFDYQTAHRSTVSEETAALWGAPAMAGKPVLVMQPASGDDFFLRFIESTPVVDYTPLTTAGWNATELLVQDPDTLAEQLQNSPFSIIGMPRDLSSDGHVRAMQVQGPSGEVIYLTRISGKRVNMYSSAQSKVDRAFILTIGTNNFDDTIEFYGERFDHNVLSFGKTTIRVISKAMQLDAETLYPMKIAQIGNRQNIEIEGYPIAARNKPSHADEIPPGMSLVTFEVSSLEALALDWQHPPQRIDDEIYQNALVATCIGPAGEWLEFIQR